MNKYSPLLQPGEMVADIQQPDHGTQEWAYGYVSGEVKNSTHYTGNSVVLDVEPRCAVEPVLITSDITLTVQVLQGRGYAVIYNVENQDNVRVVEIHSDTDALVLRKGDAYYYLNDGEDNLILRDDSTPAFQNGDEVQLTVGDGRSVKLPAMFWRTFELTK